jgi:hypothetical protein
VILKYHTFLSFPTDIKYHSIIHISAKSLYTMSCQYTYILSGLQLLILVLTTLAPIQT